jgi:hypothetical protein
MITCDEMIEMEYSPGCQGRLWARSIFLERNTVAFTSLDVDVYIVCLSMNEDIGFEVAIELST